MSPARWKTKRRNESSAMSRAMATGIGPWLSISQTSPGRTRPRSSASRSTRTMIEHVGGRSTTWCTTPVGSVPAAGSDGSVGRSAPAICSSGGPGSSSSSPTPDPGCWLRSRAGRTRRPAGSTRWSAPVRRPRRPTCGPPNGAVRRRWRAAAGGCGRPGRRCPFPVAEGPVVIGPRGEVPVGVDPAHGVDGILAGRRGTGPAAPLPHRPEILGGGTAQQVGLAQRVEDGGTGELRHLGPRERAGAERLLGAGQSGQPVADLEGRPGLPGGYPLARRASWRRSGGRCRATRRTRRCGGRAASVRPWPAARRRRAARRGGWRPPR